jgi:hydroxyethylthiazole kinase-like uncharacterized protein yjeF
MAQDAERTGPRGWRGWPVLPDDATRLFRPAVRGTGQCVLTSDQSREVDQIAETAWGLSTPVLMENAGRGLAELVLCTLHALPELREVVVVCGPGNNGGDGLVAARHLHNAGVLVQVVLALPAQACRGECARQLLIVQRMGIAIAQWTIGAGGEHMSDLRTAGRQTLVIDAIFGTGLARLLDASVAALVNALDSTRAQGALVLAVDVPTGMDSDSGEGVVPKTQLHTQPETQPQIQCMVRADATLTFAGIKLGLTLPAGRAWAGVVYVGEIGVPQSIIRGLGRAY